MSAIPFYEDMADVWPSVDEQTAVMNEGCTCICLDSGQSSGPNPYPAEWEQNPFCVEHPIPFIMAALIKKLLRERRS